MTTRYQIFVSSTFQDLQEERRSLLNILMQLDCIPAGMEFFPAADEAQWDFIRKVIEESDYYLLVIGGRYGSMTADGISYTEKEYDYAVSRNIPIIALLHGDPSQISLQHSEIDKASRKKLELFRKKIKKGRMVKFWNSADQLSQSVVLALIYAFKTRPRPGWVRGDARSDPLPKVSSRLIPSRAQFYRECARLIGQAQSIRDTTWGRVSITRTQEENEARDAYRLSVFQAVSERKVYLELLGGEEHRSSYVKNAEELKMLSDNYEARIVSSYMKNMAMVDFIIGDNHRMILSHVDAKRTSPTFVLVDSQEIVGLFTQYFQECWIDAAPI